MDSCRGEGVEKENIQCALVVAHENARLPLAQKQQVFQAFDSCVFDKGVPVVVMQGPNGCPPVQQLSLLVVVEYVHCSANQREWIANKERMEGDVNPPQNRD